MTEEQKTICIAEIYEIWRDQEGREHVKARIETNKSKLVIGKIGIEQMRI